MFNIIPIIIVFVIFSFVIWFLLFKNKKIHEEIKTEKNKFLPYREKLGNLTPTPIDFETFNNLARDFFKERFNKNYNMTYLEIAEDFKIKKELRGLNEGEWKSNLAEISRLLNYGEERLYGASNNKQKNLNNKKEIIHGSVYLKDAYKKFKEFFDKIYLSASKENKEKLEGFAITVQGQFKNNPYTLAKIIEKGIKVLEEIKNTENIISMNDFENANILRRKEHSEDDVVQFCNLMTQIAYSGNRTNLEIKKAMSLFSDILDRYG